MDNRTGGLEDVVEHLEAKGVLTPSDTKAIVNALQHLRADALAHEPPVEKALSGTYWEGRNRALHDRKFHP
jgi:hypothetical protein